jgi:hypothetical protein
MSKTLTLLILIVGTLCSRESAWAGRYYDARTGRFLTVDPKADKFPLVSPYNYAHNNPLINIDLDGKEVRNKHYSSVTNFLSFLGLKQSTEYYEVENALHTLRSTESGEKLYQELHLAPEIIEVGVGRLPNQVYGGNVVSRQLGETSTNVIRGVIEVTIDFRKIDTQVAIGGVSREEFLNKESAPAIVTSHEFGHVKDILDKTITGKTHEEKEDYAIIYQRGVRDELKRRIEEGMKQDEDQR